MCIIKKYILIPGIIVSRRKIYCPRQAHNSKHLRRISICVKIRLMEK